MELYGGAPPHPGTIYKSASASDTADHVIVSARVGFQFMVTRIVVYNSHATQNTGVTIKGGSSGSWGPVPASSGAGGCVIQCDPPLPVLDNTALSFAASDNANIAVSVGGYYTPSNGY